jgi:hypothetical protein
MEVGSPGSAGCAAAGTVEFPLAVEPVTVEVSAEGWLAVGVSSAEGASADEVSPLSAAVEGSLAVEGSSVADGPVLVEGPSSVEVAAAAGARDIEGALAETVGTVSGALLAVSIGIVALGGVGPKPT